MVVEAIIGIKAGMKYDSVVRQNVNMQTDSSAKRYL